LVENNVSTLVIGKNENWKQEINIGKVNNQNFTSVPHAKFIEMLTYKAELVGIKVIITEESYTSVASFLDGDFLPVYGSSEAKQAKWLVRRAMPMFVADLMQISTQRYN
jgi:putative transposase